jgi:hypothetical protein
MKRRGRRGRKRRKQQHQVQLYDGKEEGKE